MAVSIDAVGTAADNAGATSNLSISLTVGSGTNQAAVFFANVSSNASTVLNVQVDSGPLMTMIPGSDTNYPYSTLGFREIAFVITGLAAGAHTFNFTQNGGNVFIVANVASFFGVHQTRPINGLGVIATGTSTSPSVTIPTESGNMTVDFVSDVPDVPGSPTQTQLWIKDGSAASTKASSGTSNTHGWTLSSSTAWLDVGFDLRAASNSGGFFPILRRIRPFALRPKLFANHPLTPGCLIASPLNDGNGSGGFIWNAAKPQWGGTAFGTFAIWQSGIEGVGVYSSNGTGYVSYGTIAALSPAPAPYTASARFEMAANPSSYNGATSNFGKVWGAWYSAGTPYQNWGIFQNCGIAGVSMGNTNGPIDLLLCSLPPGTVHTVTQTWDGVTLRGYVDGIPVGSVGITPSTGMVTGTPSIGANPYDANEYWPAPIYGVWLWNRCLSGPEIWLHASDPNGMFDYGVGSVNQDAFAPTLVIAPPMPPLLGRHLDGAQTPLEGTILHRL